MMAKLESQGPMYYTNLQVTVNLISRNSLCCVLKADNFSRKVKYLEISLKSIHIFTIQLVMEKKL